ncbi:MAG TPA: hypothetical protein VG819_07590 [Rhizomicrobium sp.]|nr:hypothetical protein [Rhizomicrobium sp.]
MQSKSVDLEYLDGLPKGQALPRIAPQTETADRKWSPFKSLVFVVGVCGSFWAVCLWLIVRAV